MIYKFHGPRRARNKMTYSQLREYECSHLRQDWMLECAEHLTSVNSLTKVTKDDVEKFSKVDRLIVTAGPGTGKSTALRQYLVDHLDEYSLVAFSRIDECQQFRYELLCYLLKLKIESGEVKDLNDFLENHYDDMIVSFTSKDRVPLSKVMNAKILIVTHERLMIEPPSVLYRVGHLEEDFYYEMTNREDDEVMITRDHIFIDEMPTFYKDISFDGMYALGIKIPIKCKAVKLDNYKPILKAVCKRVLSYANFDEIEFDEIADQISPDPEVQQVVSFIYEWVLIFGRILETSVKATIVDKLRVDLKSCELSDLFNENDRRLAKLNRFTYFLSMIIDKVASGQKKISPTEIYHIIYSLVDLPHKNIVIFDGTGDLLARSSTKWKILKDQKFGRQLRISEYCIIPNTSIDRLISSVDQVTQIENGEEVSCNRIVSLVRDEIERRLNKNIKTPLLVYHWKSMKITDDLYKNNLVYESEITQVVGLIQSI